ncbi:hypothetical protein THIOKS11320093 [Thiocapsa sp. KS1]|nr:hypothetical protein THIOKS11320093 [Thiocapsa sp. KS1]
MGIPIQLTGERVGDVAAGRAVLRNGVSPVRGDLRSAECGGKFGETRIALRRPYPEEVQPGSDACQTRQHLMQADQILVCIDHPKQSDQVIPRRAAERLLQLEDRSLTMHRESERRLGRHLSGSGCDYSTHRTKGLKKDRCIGTMNGLNPS